MSSGFTDTNLGADSCFEIEIQNVCSFWPVESIIKIYFDISQV